MKFFNRQHVGAKLSHDFDAFESNIRKELESILESSSNGTVVTSRYFLKPLEELIPINEKNLDLFNQQICTSCDNNQ